MIKLIALIVLVFFWISLDYALVHGADLELNTAGQASAPTEPFYKGAF